MSGKLKFYTNPWSRGLSIDWYLRELGTESEKIEINIQGTAVADRGDDFLKASPFGKVPAIAEPGGFTLFESGAVLMYLAEKYNNVNTPEKRAEVSQWVLFANSTLPDAVFYEQKRETNMPVVSGTLDKILADKEYLVDNAFGPADVAVGSFLLYVPTVNPAMDFSAWSNVAKYMSRLSARPAYTAAIAVATPPCQAAEAQHQESAPAAAIE